MPLLHRILNALSPARRADARRISFWAGWNDWHDRNRYAPHAAPNRRSYEAGWDCARRHTEPLARQWP